MAKALIVLALTAALVVLASGAASSNSKCEFISCGGKPNSGCLFDFKKTSNKCVKVKSNVLTPAEIKEVVDTHNKFRKIVASGKEKRGKPGPQPAATNLGDLKWDPELAKIAQAWANQCEFEHDDCRNVKRFPVGQNIAYSATTASTDMPLAQMVTGWYDEVKLFDKNQVKSVTKFERVGHYTQMMWADSTHVGCGVIRFNPGSKWNTQHLVCNYGPAGNYMKGEMYKTR